MADTSSLDEAQKKAALDLVVAVDKVDPNEFGRCRSRCVFLVDKLARLVLFDAVKEEPELAYRKDGSLFLFMSENIGLALKTERAAAYRENG